MKIENNIATYEPLTEEKLKEGLEAIGLRQQLNPRDFVVYTGEAGARAMDRSLERFGIDASIERLVQEGKLAVHEMISINRMLDSSDDRDYELAKVIIDSKL